MEIPIIGAEPDLPGCVKAPILLQEVIRACSEGEKLVEPVTTMMAIFAEMAQAAAQTDDPFLRLFALRFGLFKLSNAELGDALNLETRRSRALSEKIEARRKERAEAMRKADMEAECLKKMPSMKIEDRDADECAVTTIKAGMPEEDPESFAPANQSESNSDDGGVDAQS